MGETQGFICQSKMIMQAIFKKSISTALGPVEPWVGCNIVWAVIKPEVTDGVRQPVHPGCHMKSNCAWPTPVGGLWDILCREQVSDRLCPFAEITSHEHES